MIRILQIVATIIVFGVAPILAIDCYVDNGFLSNFLNNQSLSIMGTILAIYIAAASSFLAIMMSHEHNENKTIFVSTSVELKQNITAIMVIFLMHIFVLVGSPVIPNGEKISTLGLFFRGGGVFTFLVFIYALYELSTVLFGIRESLSKKKH